MECKFTGKNDGVRVMLRVINRFHSLNVSQKLLNSLNPKKKSCFITNKVDNLISCILIINRKEHKCNIYYPTYKKLIEGDEIIENENEEEYFDFYP